MRAAKGNREYTIDESQKKHYQDAGFDILDTDGSVIAYGRGKTVPYEDHMTAVKEIERLRKIINDLQVQKQEPAGKKVSEKKAGE